MCCYLWQNAFVCSRLIKAINHLVAESGGGRTRVARLVQHLHQYIISCPCTKLCSSFTNYGYLCGSRAALSFCSYKIFKNVKESVTRKVYSCKTRYCKTRYCKTRYCKTRYCKTKKHVHTVLLKKR